MNVLYVGHYKPGTTTWARGEQLREILQPANFLVVDIDIPIDWTPRLFKSVGWRFYIGPLIKHINDYLESRIIHEPHFDLVWIDKGVFIKPSIIKRFSAAGSKLVHYTPDTAFTHNRSGLFYKALPYYDHCVTTKSFELDDYKKGGVKKLHYTTQGYNPVLHKKYYEPEEKEGIIFIGQYEKWRGEVIQAIIDQQLTISVGGAGWERFADNMKNNPYFRYLGRELFHEVYARAISKSKVSLGLLARKFPEKHTTRTFEIPACFTALATERNEEILSFYSEEEVMYFNDIPELIEKLSRAMNDSVYLEEITRKGYQKVHAGGYDYRSILEQLVNDMSLV